VASIPYTPAGLTAICRSGVARHAASRVAKAEAFVEFSAESAALTNALVYGK
jgi:hypothetical protein